MRRTSAASRPRCCGPSAREAGDVAVFSRLGALPRIPSRPLSGDEVCSWGSVLRCWGSPYRRTNRKERRIWVTLPSGSRWEDTPCPALSPRETKWIARSCWAALSCTRACHKTRLPGCLRIRRRYDDSKAYEAFLKGLKEWERAPPSWAASPPRAPRDTKPVLANSFFLSSVCQPFSASFNDYFFFLVPTKEGRGAAVVNLMLFRFCYLFWIFSDWCLDLMILFSFAFFFG